MSPSIFVEMICALTSHCLYGYHYPWAYECLNNCHITRQCLSSYLTMPHSVLERTYQEVFTSQVSPPLTGPCFPNKEWIQMRMWSWFYFFPFIFISWRLITLQYCTDFCHTLTWIVILILNSWQTVLQNPQLQHKLPSKSPWTLAKAVLNNRGACSIWISTPGETETIKHHHSASYLAWIGDSFKMVFLWLVWSWGLWFWSYSVWEQNFHTKMSLWCMDYFKLKTRLKRLKKNLSPQMPKRMQMEDLFPQGSYFCRYLQYRLGV